MPGAYLIALLVSLAGVGLLDRRFELAFWRRRRATVIATLAGTAFFLAWDAVGIATGVFVKGDSALLLGIDLAPHLPVEEPVFLLFLSYLALVCTGAAERFLGRLSRATETATGTAAETATDPPVTRSEGDSR